MDNLTRSPTPLRGAFIRSSEETDTNLLPSLIDQAYLMALHSLLQQRQGERRRLVGSEFLYQCHLLATDGSLSLAEEAAASALKLFRKPIYIADFSLEQRAYSSQTLFPTTGDEALRQATNAIHQLLSHFSAPERDSDEPLVVKRLHRLTTPHITSRELLNLQGLDASPELTELLSPLATHLHQVFQLGHSAEPSFERLSEKQKLNSFHRSVLRNWQAILRSNLIDGSDLNCYPFFDFTTLDDLLVIVAAIPLDGNFVDERVHESHRINPITLAVYRIDHNALLHEVMPLAHQAIGRLSATTLAHKRGDALQAAAGEAAEIARYWYSSGVVKLFAGDSEEKGAFEQYDALEFWERFVEELLCATIDGVDATEIYPFDRAYIIHATGASETRHRPSIPVRVLETGLRSKHPEDLGRYLSSAERIRKDRKLDDCDVSDKRIVASNDFYLVWDGEAIRLRRKSVYDKRGSSFVGENLSSHQKAVDRAAIRAGIGRDEMSTRFAGLFQLVGPEEKRFEPERQHREFFAEEGISYLYRHGLSLNRDLSLFEGVQAAYFANLTSSAKDADHALESTDAERWAKVVYVSFDPMFHGDCRIKGEGGKEITIVDDRYAFTLILVADDDPEKSVSELEAERRDLEVLVRMIIRQQIQDLRKEHRIFHQELKAISSTLTQTRHRIKDEIKDEALKNRLLTYLEGSDRLVERSTNQLETHDFGGSHLEVISLLAGIPLPERNPGSGLYSQLLGLCNKEFLQGNSPLTRHEFKLCESLIPPLRVEIPTEGTKDAFRVLLKNAVEAATAGEAPRPRSIAVQVQAREQRDSSGRSSVNSSTWFLEIIIENSCAPLKENVIRKLNAANPAMMTPNKQKRDSSGLGVYSARTQLQNGLNGASISFLPLSPTRLQTRMSLPAELTATGVEGLTSVFHDYGRPHILYVEDEPAHSGPNVDFLQHHLKGLDAHVIHQMDYEGSHASLKEDLPELFIVDLHIPLNIDQGGAEGKYARQLFATFFQQAQELERQPPVWVASASEADEALQHIFGEGGEGTGYRMAGSGEPTTLTTPGTIHLLGTKSLAEIGQIPHALQELFPVAGTLPADAPASENPYPKGVTPLRRTSHIKAQVERHPLVDKEFKPNLTKFLREWSVSRDSSRIFMATASAATIDALAAHISRWLSHPYMPDPEFPDSPPVPLYSASDHKSVFLACETDASLSATFSPQLRYWCLCHNIALVPPDIPPERIGTLWLAMPRENKGPISVIRHDIFNLRSIAPRPEQVDKVVAASTELEKHLKVEHDLFMELRAAAKSGTERFMRLCSDHGLLTTEQSLQLENSLDQELRRFIQDLGNLRTGLSSRPDSLPRYLDMEEGLRLLLIGMGMPQ